MNRFDKAAKTWDKKQSSIDSSNACVNNLLEKVDLTKNANILDYGCGTGFIAFALSNETNNIIGMDYSDGMVERFNEKVQELNYNNIKAFKHNMNTQELPKDEFDLVISSMTMHHIKDTNIFAKKCYDALKKDAIVCINDLEKEDGSFHKKHNNEGVEHFGFDKKDVCKIFENQGFKIVSCDTVFKHERNEKKYPLFNLIAKK